jgi:signal transduction histidine kinase
MSIFTRIERMSLRSKIVVPMVALSVLPAVGICVFIISSMQTSMRGDAVEREVLDTRARADAFEEFLWAVQTDLRFLSKIRLLTELAAARSAGDSGSVDTLRTQLEQELLLFSQGKRSFYQVRYIDTQGREVVRLNIEDGRARAAPRSQLQNKSGRSYVEESLRLAADELYVSPIELNIERGRIEVPHRPVLRFGMSLFGLDGERTGIVVLNLDARHVFRLIEPLRFGTEGFLVDEDGTYLGYIGPSEQQHDRYDLTEKRKLSSDFNAEQIDTIMESSDRGGFFNTRGALVSIAPIRLTADENAARWHLIVSHSHTRFGASIRRLTLYLSVIIAIGLAVVARVGVAVADALARPVIELRKAMSEVAPDRTASMRFAGPGPANEIEALWGEFQSMARRLEQAQSRLQGMQAGLAEAEKQSSIGQLVRGMLHDFGEPLSAIKSKLCAAGASNFPPGLDAMRNNLLADVGRMEAVLQSFTQLANVPGPEPEVTSLATVVKNAVTLVGPEMRRRGLRIDVEAESGVPPVKGDLNQLRQLLINLILNAADAKPRSERIVMKISAVMPDDSDGAVPVGARIRVIDDGSGIRTEALVKIWDPFFTTKQDGLGLGLAICRQIVEEHGGSIEVSSQVDHGTTVTVSFPVASV